jgi:hypothetical protein
METPEPVKSLGICVLYHKETYKGKRYIDAEILSGFKIVLDFNMAYYPSYAYNKNSSAYCLHGEICRKAKFESVKEILNKFDQKGRLREVYF